MLFNSSNFALFFICVFILYYLPIARGKQVCLLVFASLLFYGFVQPHWLLLLIGSVCINALVSWHLAKSDNSKYKLWCTAGGITLNLIILAGFKYASSAALALAHLAIFPPVVIFKLMYLVLPIGISFYTFEAISLLIDCKRQASDVDTSQLKHVRNTALFFSFFPHLAAGPIVRVHQFYRQIGDKELKDIDWRCVIESLIVGYFLKNVVADNLAVHTTAVLMAYQSWSSIDNMVALMGYSARLFADFAGYSLIAIGLAASFGYKLPINFNYPYISQSFAEFWSRWHITLSTWIRDYLYFPIGGNRRGKMRTYVNLLIAMTLAGLWHGGKLGFAAWGLYHGVCLCLERALGLARSKASTFAGQLGRTFIIFTMVAFGFSIFVLPLDEVRPFFLTVADHWQWPADRQHIFIACLFCVPIFIWHFNYLARQNCVRFAMPSTGKFRELALACLLFLIITSSGTPQEFLYFQF